MHGRDFWCCLKVQESQRFSGVEELTDLVRGRTVAGTRVGCGGFHLFSGVVLLLQMCEKKKKDIWSRLLENRGKTCDFMAAVHFTRDQKASFFTSPQYALVLQPRPNVKNNRDQIPFLH